MTPQTPVGRVHKDLRIHLHVEPTVYNPPTGKHQRMGFICLDDAKFEILIERGARNRLPLVHGAVSAIEALWPRIGRATLRFINRSSLSARGAYGGMPDEAPAACHRTLAGVTRGRGGPWTQVPTRACHEGLSCARRTDPAGTAARASARLRSALRRSTESTRKSPFRSPRQRSADCVPHRRWR
jgi:hypothetical protein